MSATQNWSFAHTTSASTAQVLIVSFWKAITGMESRNRLSKRPARIELELAGLVALKRSAWTVSSRGTR